MSVRPKQDTDPGVSRQNTPLPRIVSVSQMALILRNKESFGIKDCEKLAVIPQDLERHMAHYSVMLPIPEIDIVELQNRFSQPTRRPCVDHAEGLHWDGVRIEKEPPYWLRIDCAPQPYMATEFTPFHNQLRALEGRRLPSALELVIFYLARGTANIEFRTGIMSLVSGSKTVRGEHIIVSSVHTGQQLHQIRMFSANDANLPNYKYVLAQESAS
jgi:hypothetical protein